MPDPQDVENDVREVLMELGYSRQSADWVITQWLPTNFHLQSPEQRMLWMIDTGLVDTVELKPQTYTDENGKPLTKRKLEASIAGFQPNHPERVRLEEMLAEWGKPVNQPIAGPAFWDVQEQIGTRARAQAELANRLALEATGQADWQIEQARTQAKAIAQAEKERQGQITERYRELAQLAPGEAEVTAPFLAQARGVSPAFQRVAERALLPDIFQELGMAQRRKGWWETTARQIAEQLLPETEQEKELMALKRADPWAQLLSQPTFLQQLETRFKSLSPAERGFSQGQFRPRTRFI